MNRLTTYTATTAALVSALLAGCASTPNHSVPQSTSTVPAATEHAIGDVPWGEVGPGWMLAMWSPIAPRLPGQPKPPAEPTSATAIDALYLIAPAGDRYKIAEFGPDQKAKELVDWSGDGSHALFAPDYGQDGNAVSIDLHSGERTLIPVTGAPKYARPDGAEVLQSARFIGSKPGVLTRIDTTGTTQMTYPTDDLGGAGQYSGDYLATADGTRLVLSTANLGNDIVPRSDNSLVVVDEGSGSIIRTLAVPTAMSLCTPVKWWAADVVLTHCAAAHGAEQLWEVPLNGGTPIALTELNRNTNEPGFEGNLGNWDAFELASGTYLPTAAGCGATFVSKLTADGHTERLNIPDMNDSVALKGVSAGKLVIVDQADCAGSTSLYTYDLHTGTSTLLLGPPIVGGSTRGLLLYPTTPQRKTP